MDTVAFVLTALGASTAAWQIIKWSSRGAASLYRGWEFRKTTDDYFFRSVNLGLRIRPDRSYDRVHHSELVSLRKGLQEIILSNRPSRGASLVRYWIDGTNASVTEAAEPSTRQDQGWRSFSIRFGRPLNRKEHLALVFHIEGRYEDAYYSLGETEQIEGFLEIRVVRRIDYIALRLVAPVRLTTEVRFVARNEYNAVVVEELVVADLVTLEYRRDVPKPRAFWSYALIWKRNDPELIAALFPAGRLSLPRVNE